MFAEDYVIYPSVNSANASSGWAYYSIYNGYSCEDPVLYSFGVVTDVCISIANYSAAFVCDNDYIEVSLFDSGNCANGTVNGTYVIAPSNGCYDSTDTSVIQSSLKFGCSSQPSDTAFLPEPGIALRFSRPLPIRRHFNQL